jgi:beta-glucosidase
MTTLLFSRPLSAFLVSVCLVLVCCATGVKADELYLDPSQPIDRRVDDLISKMTLEEKAAELDHSRSENVRLHIPAWGGWNQCSHGVWSKQPTTLFPVSIAMAATWDPDLVHEEADAIADEARALYNIKAPGIRGTHGLVYRAPVINMCRDPRWGRIQEAYGEDPILTSRLGVAYVKGLQGHDPKYLKIAATLKHYAVNNQEKDRYSLSAEVPERMLYEYWLPHFRACVVDGHAASIMAAYNSINGSACVMNKLLLTDILRDKWGFDGFVVSDLNDIKYLMTGHKYTSDPRIAVAQSLLAGCDLSDEQYGDSIPAAVHAGLLTEDAVNTALKRVLNVAFRLGVFDDPNQVPFSKIPASVIDSTEHRALALKAEEKAIVLLRNKDSFLPFDKSKIKKVAAIGPLAVSMEIGSYYGKTPLRVGAVDGLKKFLGTGVEVSTTLGCEVQRPAAPTDIDQAVQAAKNADVVLLFLGTNTKVEGETIDRANIDLPGDQEKLLEAVVRANPRTVLVLSNAGPLALGWAKENVPAILECWYPGEEGGDAIANVLFGNYNPGGRLPYTNYATLADVPPQNEYDITKGFTYMYYGGKPLFPFGYGLSYTTFSYSHLHLDSPTIASGEKQDVAIDVQNSGRVAGDEVVQLYIHNEKCSVPQPIKKLAAFKRVHLEPGEKETVTLTANPDSMAIYNVDKHEFVVEPGTIDVLVGSSSEDIRAQAQFVVQP